MIADTLLLDRLGVEEVEELAFGNLGHESCAKTLKVLYSYESLNTEVVLGLYLHLIVLVKDVTLKRDNICQLLVTYAAPIYI